MRVLLVSHGFPPVVGGVETYLGGLRRCLLKRGHEVRILTGGSGPFVDGVVRHQALQRTYLVDARAGLPRDRESPTLRAELVTVVSDVVSSFQPDIVHAHNAHHFAPELAAALFSLVKPERLVNTVHDRLGEHLYAEVLALPWARTLFASRFLADSFRPTRNAAVCYLGIDLTVLRAGGPDPQVASYQHPVMLMPARLLPWKGQAVAVRALAATREALGAGTLVLCGSEQISDGADAVRAFRVDLAAQAAALGISEAVRFHAFPPERVGTAYRASDIVWCPTIDEEPFGLVPVEAMALGVPVVASRSGGMVETVIHGQTGMLVPRGDAAALAQTTVTVLRDRDLRQRLVDAGHRRAAEFAIERHGSALLSIYEQLATTSPRERV